jgi:hypothetical protein
MRAIIIALACVAASAHAQATKRFGDNPCLAQGGAQACEKLARDVSHDIGAVRALGDELERSGRFEDAAVAYRIALDVHPEHRDLLQRLIRVRGQARSLRLLGSPGAAPAALKERPLKLASLPKEPPPKEPPPKVPAPSEGRYLALIIGNEQYSQFNALKTPMADAQAIATVLKNDYGFTATVLNTAPLYKILSALSPLWR